MTKFSGNEYADIPGLKEHEETTAKCECEFPVDICATNPCYRKQVHLAGLTPGSKWPDGAPIAEVAKDAMPALEQAKMSIIAASIGSCTCLCKSPNVAFHSADCRYLKLMHALDCLDDAAATRSCDRNTSRPPRGNQPSDQQRQ